MIADFSNSSQFSKIIRGLIVTISSGGVNREYFLYDFLKGLFPIDSDRWNRNNQSAGNFEKLRWVGKIRDHPRMIIIGGSIIRDRISEKL